MPCIDAVFMYSMLVVAADSGGYLSMYSYVCCVVIPISGYPSNIDASSAFEIETFQFHNILQTDDFPKCWMSHTLQYSRTKMPSRRSIGL